MSSVAITQGAGTPIDTNVVAGNNRQIISIGDPSASTQATVGSNGLKVDIGSTLGPSATSPAYSLFRNTALSNTAVAVKASAGNVGFYHLYNPNSADAYFQFYNVAQGSVIVGTTTPNLTLWVPGLGVLDSPFSGMLGFSTAITIAATTTIAGGVAPSAGLLVGLGYV